MGQRKIVKNTKKGFTLIEILIVFTLIGILVGLAIPQYKHSLRKAREAVLKDNLYQMRKLINQYFADKGKYPLSLQTLVDEDYLMAIPIDPMTGVSDTWIEIVETPSDEELTIDFQPGIVDVQSGSDQIAIDGTPYSTW